MLLPQFPKIVYKNVARGRAQPKQNLIVLPKWLDYLPECAREYYLTHELVHFEIWKHGDKFRQLEYFRLYNLGITIWYSKEYPIAIKKGNITVIMRFNGKSGYTKLGGGE